MNFYPLKDAQRIHPPLDNQNGQRGPNAPTLAKYGFGAQKSLNDPHRSDTSQFTDLLLSNRNVPMQSNMDFFTTSLKPKDDFDWQRTNFEKNSDFNRAMPRDAEYRNEDKNLQHRKPIQTNPERSNDTYSDRERVNQKNTDEKVAVEPRERQDRAARQHESRYHDRRDSQGRTTQANAQPKHTNTGNEMNDRGQATPGSNTDHSKINEPNSYNRTPKITESKATKNEETSSEQQKSGNGQLTSAQNLNGILNKFSDDSETKEFQQTLLQVANGDDLSEGKKILNLLSGQLSQLVPSEIPSLISGNNFISEALASNDVRNFLNQKQPMQQLLSDLGFSDKALLQQLPDNTKLISPTELLSTLGLDPQNVGIEVELMQKNIQIDGVSAYMQRAMTTVTQNSNSQENTNKHTVQQINQKQAMQLQGVPLTPTEQIRFNNQQTIQMTEDLHRADQGRLLTDQQIPKLQAGENRLTDQQIIDSQAQGNYVFSSQTQSENIFEKLSDNRDSQVDFTTPLVTLSKQTLSKQTLSVSSPATELTDVNVTKKLPEQSTLLQFSNNQEKPLKDPEQGPNEATLFNFQQSNLTQPNPATIHNKESTEGYSSLTDEETKLPMAELVTEDPMQQLTNEWADNSTTLFSAQDIEALTDAQSKDEPTELQSTDIQSNQEPFIQGNMVAQNQFGSKNNNIKNLSLDNGFSEPNTMEITGVDSLEGGLETDLQNGSEGQSDTSDMNQSTNQNVNSTQSKKTSSNIKGPSFSERLQSTNVKSAVLDPIINNAKMMLKDGGGSIRIDLGTQELGSIDLAIEVQENALELKIAAGSEMAKEIIGAELPKLKEALLNQNLDLKSVEIGLKSEQQWSQSFSENGGGQQGFNREEYTEYTDQNGNTRVEKRTQYSSRSVNAESGKSPNHQGQIQVRV